LEKLNLNKSDLPDQHDRDAWPELKIKFQDIFSQKTQLEWTTIFDGSDACVTPVLSFTDPIPNSNDTNSSKQWPRQAAMPQPAPLLLRTPAIKAQTAEDPFLSPGKHSIEILNEFGVQSNEIQHLLKSGAIVDSSSSSSSL
jgi:alpha-methylacyl-CoA racemase